MFSSVSFVDSYKSNRGDCCLINNLSTQTFLRSRPVLTLFLLCERFTFLDHNKISCYIQKELYDGEIELLKSYYDGKNLDWFFFICLINCRLERLITNKRKSRYRRSSNISLTFPAGWASDKSFLTILILCSCWVAASWPATPAESMSTISNSDCSFSSFFLKYYVWLKMVFNVNSCLTRLTWTTFFTFRMTFFVTLLSYVSISGSSLNETDFLTFLPWNVFTWVLSNWESFE